jgi:hypothetical protein
VKLRFIADYAQFCDIEDFDQFSTDFGHVQTGLLDNYNTIPSRINEDVESSSSNTPTYPLDESDPF